MSWSTSELRVRLAPWIRFKPSSKLFYWPYQGGTSFVDILCVFLVLCLLCLCARLFICVLWSPVGKGLTSWLSFVVFNCEFVTFPVVSWASRGTWLYRFLIFAPLLTLSAVCDCVISWSYSLFYINKIFKRKVANIFLSISLDKCFRWLKEHWDGSFE